MTVIKQKAALELNSASFQPSLDDNPKVISQSQASWIRHCYCFKPAIWTTRKLRFSIHSPHHLPVNRNLLIIIQINQVIAHSNAKELVCGVAALKFKISTKILELRSRESRYYVKMYYRYKAKIYDIWVIMDADHEYDIRFIHNLNRNRNLETGHNVKNELYYRYKAKNYDIRVLLDVDHE